MSARDEHEADGTDVDFLLSEYVSGTLPARQARALERRLRDEPELRAELQRYVTLEQELAGLADQGPADVDYDLQRAEIVRALERKALLHGPARRPWAIRRVLVPLAAAAAVVLVASAAWLAFRAGPEPPAGGQVTVMLLPPAPGADPRGPVVAALVGAPAPLGPERKPVFEYRSTGWDEVRLSVADSSAGEPGLPPGTVMVSTGRPPEDEADLLPLGFAGMIR